MDTTLPASTTTIPTPCSWSRHSPPARPKSSSTSSLPPLGVRQGNADTLYRLRDELLVTTPRGRRLIDLFYRHGLELSPLLLSDEALRTEGAEVLLLALPGLEALVNGQGETVVVTQEMVDALDIFLSHLYSLAGPDLQAVIEEEWQRSNPPALVGRTFAGAWEQVAGQWVTFLPVQYASPREPPPPEVFQFGGHVYLGDLGDDSTPLGEAVMVLYGVGGRHGPHTLLGTAQTGADGAFVLDYTHIGGEVYGYYTLAVSDTRYTTVGVWPGPGAEEWEPHWIQYPIPVAGSYGESAFFVHGAGR